MPTYKELNALPAEAFLNADNFRTINDGLPTAEYRANQYKIGMETGKNAVYVSVGCNGTWGAKMQNGANVTSYEGIGYHSCTADLWRGVLDSGATIKIYRADGCYVLNRETGKADRL